MFLEWVLKGASDNRIQWHDQEQACVHPLRIMDWQNNSLFSFCQKAVAWKTDANTLWYFYVAYTLGVAPSQKWQKDAKWCKMKVRFRLGFHTFNHSEHPGGRWSLASWEGATPNVYTGKLRGKDPSSNSNAGAMDGKPCCTKSHSVRSSVGVAMRSTGIKLNRECQRLARRFISLIWLV